MRLSGHLINATASGKHDVFDGYSVEIRYFVLAERGEPPTYREVADQFVCRGKDNAFSFEFPDIQDLALDKELQVRVRNRSGKEALNQSILLASLIRTEKPLDLAIHQIEPPAIVTPLTLKGQLKWKNSPGKTESFEGFKVSANFNVRDPGFDEDIFVPHSAVTTLMTGNKFSISLPNKEELKDEPILIMTKYPDGQTATTGNYSIAQLKDEVILFLEAQPPPVIVKTDSRAEEAKPERIKGKVVDLEGKIQIKNKQVILWAKRPEGNARPIVVAVTDNYGNFSGDWPKDIFEGALATVAGTLHATLDEGVPIELVEVVGQEPALTGRMADMLVPVAGKFPKFVYLVVTLPHPYEETEGECACYGAGVPRQPDPEDLVSNASAYSQDIGLNCVNFTTPNRTLEEFVFTMVVRTTDPEIKGTTLSDLDRRTERERSIRNRAVIELAKPASVRSIGKQVSAVSTEVSLKTSMIVGNALSAKEASALSNYAMAKPLLSPFWSDLFKTVPGRGELNANNSVDWDGTPTFYQATTIAHGHILYYKQIWKADGYSMGDLLYSLPLAPGQKKQVVIFDWDRTEYGRRDEATHEDEALNSYLSHNRDINDITQGTFSEQLRGGSEAHTSGSAGGVGAGAGALLGPVMIGVAGGYSTSSGSSSSSAWQDSSRNVAATGINQLRDMVQQGASAVRNQRSTVVQTARQTERFKVETEVVANHNHCHAITIQYFEVLRHYAIEQKLTHVQECLFIPLLMSEFDIPKIMRWRDSLRQSLLLPLRRRPLSIFGEHPLIRGLAAAERIFLNYEGSDFPADSYASETLVNLSGELRISFKLNRPLDDDDNADDPARQEQLIAATVLNAPGWGIWWALGLGQTEFYQQYFANQKVKYKNKIFEERVAPVLAEEVVDNLAFTAMTAAGVRYPLQVDTTLVSNYQREAELYVTVRPKGGINIRRDQIEFIEISTNVDLSRSANSKIIIHSATFRYSTPHLNAYLARDYRVDNDLKPNDPVVIYTPLSAEEKRKPREEDKQFSRLLIEHLNANLEYYHKVIWQRMDPDRRYMLLDGFLAPNSNGKSVASVVENKVIGVAGNCLIMPVAPGYKLDPTYQHEPERDDRGQPKTDEAGNPIYKPISLLDHYQPLTPIPPFRVSVPTRGVFTEAVMGACNSCEKWEEERYWKWEEHPIPEEPTPIAPVQTAPPQRTEPGDLKPSPFPTPMINIQNAPPTPEPGATLAGALGLLGKPDVFPNITGLDQNQKNALQAMLSNQDSAKHFADKAAELAVQSANLKSGNSTIESIKKSMDDGTLDKATGKKLIEDTYRAQIGGKTTPPEQPINTANHSKLSDATAEAVKSGRELKAKQTHPDGTETQIEQKGTGASADLSSAATIGLERPDPTTPGKWIPIALGDGPGMAQFDGAFSTAGLLQPDFPAKDSGRFRIVLTDPAFKTSSSVPVSLNTIYDNGTNQSFEAGGSTTIDVEPDPSDPNRRVSAPLVVVADAEDLILANSVGTRKNARLGGMFGRIVIEREGKKFDGPILPRSKHRLLPMHIFVVKHGAGDGGAGTAGFTTDSLAKQLRGMQQIFEPHGIFFNSQPYTFSTAQAAFNPSERTAGVEVVYRYYELDIPATEIANLAQMTLDDVYKLGALFPPVPGSPVLRLFFIPGFASPKRLATSINQSGIDGLSTLDAATKAKILNCVFIGPRASRIGAAHEIGHTLMDKNKYMRDNSLTIPTNASYIHHYKTPSGDGYPEINNLMYPDDTPTMRRIWSVTDGDGYNWKRAIETNASKLLLPP